MIFFHNMDTVWRMPTQEFAVKVGLVFAGLAQLMALIFLFIIAVTHDGDSLSQVLNTLTWIALGSTGMGILLGGAHVLRNSDGQAPSPTSAPLQSGNASPVASTSPPGFTGN